MIRCHPIRRLHNDPFPLQLQQHSFQSVYSQIVFIRDIIAGQPCYCAPSSMWMLLRRRRRPQKRQYSFIANTTNNRHNHVLDTDTFDDTPSDIVKMNQTMEEWYV